MRRTALSIITCFLFSVVLIVSQSFSQPIDQRMLEILPLGGRALYLDVYEDGKMTGEKIIAEPFITSDING